MLQVISQVYSMKIARNMLSIQSTTNEFDIDEFIAKPEVTRSNRNFITIIVNGRYIKSLALNYAIIRAFDTLLPRHRFPIAVISISLDPILVDVNVHPTKLEVRFSKEKELVRVIEQTIQEKLRQLTLIPSITYENKEKKKVEQHTLNFDQDPVTEHKTLNTTTKERNYVSQGFPYEKIYEPLPKTEKDNRTQIDVKIKPNKVDDEEVEEKNTNTLFKDEKNDIESEEEGAKQQVHDLYQI